MKKVILAYSGGLDTSFCVKYLQNEKGLEVYSAFVNTGNYSEEELQAIENRAYELGVKKHINLNKTEEYYTNIIKYLIFGNVLKNNSYPLSVSAERIFQAIAIAEYAKAENADYIAHGSTGAGNDQVRFDLAFSILTPSIKVITPIRDLKLSRQEEIEYLAKNGVEYTWEKAKYSINKGLWGTSVGGVETLTSNQYLPSEAFPSQLLQMESSKLTIEFKEGEITHVNGEEMSPVKAIELIDSIANEYAIGRDIHVGDTIIGIKGRVGFEAAASSIIIKAHHHLEKHTLTKWQLHWKEQLANWYGMFLHEAHYFEPVMRNIEQFLSSTQKNVNGKVMLELHPYRFEIHGIESKNDLMNAKFGQYGEVNNTWNGEDVKGFTKILSNSLSIYYSVNNEI
ncbi:MAG: argininosuccinate synthase [Flavobacteriia bacterium]|nr:argininosuccinate synthase [Flavobacteriia bacterium]